MRQGSITLVAAFVACSVEPGVPLAPSRSLAISPAALDFGTVELGDVRSLELTLHASGEESVEPMWRQAPDCAGPFCLDLLPDRVDAGETVRVGARFRPRVVGVASSTVGIAICDDDECVSWIHLQGLGESVALSCTPTPLELGDVHVGNCSTALIECLNTGSVALEVLSARIADVRFSIQDHPAGRLRPGEVGRILIQACSDALGRVDANLSIETDRLDKEVPIRFEGTDPRLEISPEAFDLGEVAVAVPLRRVLRLRNAGQSVLRLSFDRSSNRLQPLGAPSEIAPAATATMAIEWTPSQVGALHDELVVRSNDQRRSERIVTFDGVGVELPACQAAATGVDLGPIEIERRGQGIVVLENRGESDCLYYGTEIEALTGEAFEVTSLGPNRLGPGELLPLQVTMAPTVLGGSTARLEIQVSGPSVIVEVGADGADGFLRVVPDPIDFGTVTVGCPRMVQSVRIQSPFPERPAILRGLSLRPIWGNGMELVEPPMPVELPGPNIELALTPSPGRFLAELLVDVEVDGLRATSRVPIRGEVVASDARLERFEQLPSNQLDVLFVLDDTATPAPRRDAVASGAASYLARLETFGVDYHLAVTTTDADPIELGGYGVQGRFTPVDDEGAPKVITNALPNRADNLLSSLLVGTNGSGSERALEGARKAFTQPLRRQGNRGMLRPSSSFVVVLLSDDVEQSPLSVERYADLLISLRPDQDPNRLEAVTIVGEDPPGCIDLSCVDARYIEVLTRLGGRYVPLFTVDANTLTSLPVLDGHRDHFVLSGRPEPSTLVVRVDGQLIPGPEAGPSASYRYDEPRHELVFTPLSVPEIGAEIEVTYQDLCR